MKTIGNPKTFKIEPTNKIYVASAGKKGRGIFASIDISKGDLIEVAPTLYISEAEEGLIAGTNLRNYNFNAHDEKGSVIALGFASLYNHSSKIPNATWDMGENVIVFTAIKNIVKDSEILVDYGWDKTHLSTLGIKE